MECRERSRNISVQMQSSSSYLHAGKHTLLCYFILVSGMYSRHGKIILHTCFKPKFM